MVPPFVQLDPTERMFHWGYEAVPGFGTVIARARIQGRVTPEQIRRSVRVLGERYPQLRASIQTLRRRPTFVVDPAAPPLECQIAPAISEDAWTDRVASLRKHRFDVARGPLLRVDVLLSETEDWSDVLLTGHHCVVDGVSLIQLYRHLLSSLEQPPESVVSATWSRPNRMPLPKSGWLRSLCRYIDLIRTLRANGNHPLAKITWSAASQEQSRYLILDEAETTCIVRKARQEQTTVFGALLSMAAQTFAEELYEPACRLIVRSPYSLRSCYDPFVADDQVGLHVQGMRLALDAPSRAPFWDVARQGRAQMDQFFACGGPVFSRWLLNRFGSLIAGRLLRHPPPPSAHLAINNLGNVQDLASPNKHYTVSEWVWYHDHAGIAPPGVSIKAVTVNGRMNLILTSAVHTEETFPGFVDRCLRRLRQAVGAPASTSAAMNADALSARSAQMETATVFPEFVSPAARFA